jgi:hypothetical protein
MNLVIKAEASKVSPIVRVLTNTSRGKCQENTINFCLPKISFNIAGFVKFFMGAAMGGLMLKIDHIYNLL